jgi:hypothetical protein
MIRRGKCPPPKKKKKRRHWPNGVRATKRIGRPNESVPETCGRRSVVISHRKAIELDSIFVYGQPPLLKPIATIVIIMIIWKAENAFPSARRWSRSISFRFHTVHLTSAVYVRLQRLKTRLITSSSDNRPDLFIIIVTIFVNSINFHSCVAARYLCTMIIRTRLVKIKNKNYAFRRNISRPCPAQTSSKYL